MLDEQVTRGAVKAYNLFTSNATSKSTLSSSSRYLHTLNDAPIALSSVSWTTPHVLVDLLERRAAYIVRHHAHHLDDPDASVNQRVSRAVTEAFVAVQTLQTINSAPPTLGQIEYSTLVDVLTLVRHNSLQSSRG